MKTEYVIQNIITKKYYWEWWNNNSRDIEEIQYKFWTKTDIYDYMNENEECLPWIIIEIFTN